MADHFTQLLEWRRGELAVRGLAKIPAEFYGATSAYLAELRRSYESELRENPSGRKGEISRQTYQRAVQVARDIVEGRSQKVVHAAFQASIGGSRDLVNALSEERAMFDQVLATLLEFRRTSAAYIEPVSGPPAPAAVPRPAPAAAPSPPPASPPAALSARPRPPLVYVRVLKDSRPVQVGSDTVDLKADDVISLPVETARLLAEAKVVAPLETVPNRPVT